MKSRKILTILGARPQFIKASAISAALEKSLSLREVMVHTGQHFDDNMSEVFFLELGIRKADYTCGIHGGCHGEMTGRMLIEIEQILLLEAPDAVLVYGDTNSTLAGALAAVKLGIPVAHVEAGLRCFNMSTPEEINRIVADHISRWLFTPTKEATSNLIREGMAPSAIYTVGDVMFDVALRHSARPMQSGGMYAALRREKRLTVGNYCLATIHRAESTDDVIRLKAIVAALIGFAKEMPVVFPVHPRTRQSLELHGLLHPLAAAVVLTSPLGYIDMIELEKNASIIATDSGGVQKEAFFHKVPCVTLRNETEWIELVDAGWNRLVPPTDANTILTALRAAVGTRGLSISPYGDGDTATQIVARLECILN